MSKSARIGIELSAPQAWALAQFVKRVGWQEMRGCAVDDPEAYAIREAIEHLRMALIAAGFAPRWERFRRYVDMEIRR